jgi:hypothetical protein
MRGPEKSSLDDDYISGVRAEEAKMNNHEQANCRILFLDEL